MQPMPITEALVISAEEGEVLLEGHPGVALSMTPDVALAASERLRDAARQATARPTSPDLREIDD